MPIINHIKTNPVLESNQGHKWIIIRPQTTFKYGLMLMIENKLTAINLITKLTHSILTVNLYSQEIIHHQDKIRVITNTSIKDNLLEMINNDVIRIYLVKSHKVLRITLRCNMRLQHQMN